MVTVRITFWASENLRCDMNDLKTLQMGKGFI
jgi:hypothetical protein